MTIINEDENRLAIALETAEANMWESIAASYPEAITGDLSPLTAIALATALETATVEWIKLNVPTPPEQLTTEVMLHRIEYYYREEPDMRITASDEEHIAYCISQGMSSGELCTLMGDSETEVYGWWEINNHPT